MKLQFIEGARVADNSWFEKLTGIDLIAPTPQDINRSTIVPDDSKYVVQMGEHRSYWQGVTSGKMIWYAFLRIVGAAIFISPSLLAYGVIFTFPAMGAAFLLFSVISLVFAARYVAEICNIRRIFNATSKGCAP
jgi:hypothetical protein